MGYRDAITNSTFTDVDRDNPAACCITSEPVVIGERVQSGSRRLTDPLLLSNRVRLLPNAAQELREANRQFIGSALLYCSGFPGADVVKGSGWIAACRNTPVPISNAIFLSRSIIDEADLDRRAQGVASYVRRKESPPLLLLCREWVPEYLHARVGAYIASAGLIATKSMTGMAADQLLRKQPVGVGLEFRRVINEAMRRDFADINSAAYGFPLEAERQALAVPQIWNARALSGYVGYRNGCAAAAAGAMALHGAIHIVCVATHPEYQRCGFAEAAIRHALHDMRSRTGLTRTTLSATEAGRPLYHRMGYHETATFVMYTRPSTRLASKGGRHAA
jgi:ribosomal protein S18 acetylase RimI-like enzyme